MSGGTHGSEGNGGPIHRQDYSWMQEVSSPRAMASAEFQVKIAKNAETRKILCVFMCVPSRDIDPTNDINVCRARCRVVCELCR